VVAEQIGNLLHKIVASGSTNGITGLFLLAIKKQLEAIESFGAILF